MHKWAKKIIKAVLPQSVVMFILKRRKFPGSKAYWEKRYAEGGISGEGSYNKFAGFKAEVINGFVKKHNIQSIIEFGCGDGNQLSLAAYPHYTGIDVSKTAVEMCKKRFKNDDTKTFIHYDDYTDSHRAELVLSLDVIFHLVEDCVFEEYIDRLFQTSTKFVIIYASDFDGETNYHLRPRNFSKYIKEKIPEWNLTEYIQNKYFPVNEHDPPRNRRVSDFYIYSK